MSLNIYQISSKYKKLLNEFYESDIITEEMEKQLNECKDDIEQAAINKYYAIIHFNHDLNAVNEEIKRLQSRSKLLKEKIEVLEKSTIQNLQENGINKAKSPYFDLTIRENRERVVIDDESLLDRKFFKEKVTETISLTQIHDEIKIKGSVKGAHLERSKSLVAKFGKKKDD